MIPFPGDWHFLKNFQEVLIKIYFDAGLCELAKASGYQPNSIGCNFKRTHHFLLETWESLYRHFLHMFLSNQAPPDFMTYACEWIKSFPPSKDQNNTLRNLSQLLDDLTEKYPDCPSKFEIFMKEQTEKYQTWHFWSQFVFEDCFAYISQYLAMRSGQWDLRMAAIKSMAALFTAFDRPNYQKLIPQHIVDMLTIPEDLLSKLSHGGFTVSIRGRPGHSVEAHEMCVNKDCKEYITRPSADYINRTAAFLPVRAKAIKNLETQLFPEHKHVSVIKPITTIHTKEVSSTKLEMNVRSQMLQLEKATSLTLNSPEKSLCHLFQQKQPSPEQIHDLINFRKIGQTEYERRVEYFVLRNPSVKAPKRRKRLYSFTERRATKRKVSEIERERKLKIECWKKRVAFASKTGTNVNTSYEQCLELPRAIATSKGDPVKGTKSTTTTVYEKSYTNASPAIIITAYPQGWVPDTVVMEGMFLININPWSGHKSIGEYATFLLMQHILPHFRNRTTKVHVLFDDPECQIQSPIFFER